MSVGPNRYAAPIKEEYTFFSRAHRTLCKIEHGLGYKTSPNKSKIKIIYSIFFDHNVMKLGISNRKKKTGKSTNMWKFNNTFLTDESKKEVTGNLENI